MITKEVLTEGIEWISKKTKVTAKYENKWGTSSYGNYLKICLYPEYPNESPRIYLDLYMSSQKRVEIIDLVGNGYFSERQNCGYGTQIFNIAIQAIYAFYGIIQSDALASEIIVFGNTSSVDDPDTEPERSECGKRRNAFWSSFGFILSNPEVFNTSIKASLSDLHLKKTGFTRNGTPKFISIDQFWLSCEAPEFLESDLESLKEVDFKRLELSGIPTDEDIDGSSKRLSRLNYYIRLFIFIVLSVLITCLAWLTQEPNDATFISILSILLIYPLTSVFEHKTVNLLQNTSSYKKYMSLSEKQLEMIKGVKAYIQGLEESHNGLIWRLHAGLKYFDKMSDESFYMIADLSKRQLTHRVSEFYQEYGRFIAIANSIGADGSSVKKKIANSNNTGIEKVKDSGENHARKDSFFGNVYDENDVPCLHLSDVGRMAKNVSTNFFTSQLNRILYKCKGHLMLTCCSSRPDFWDFISKVETEQIGFIEIYACTNVNSCVAATLACDVMMLNGVITVNTHWCAWKALRADEIVSTLLVPLHLKTLHEKTYIRRRNNQREVLLRGDDYEEELENVFKLAKYPSAMTWGKTEEEKVNEYIDSLHIATDIGKQGIAITDAWSCYKKKMKDHFLASHSA